MRQINFKILFQVLKSTSLYFLALMIVGGVMIGIAVLVSVYFDFPFRYAEISLLIMLITITIILKYKQAEKAIKEPSTINEETSNISDDISREQADRLLREFRSECLPHGKYPDYIIIQFLNDRFGTPE